MINKNYFFSISTEDRLIEVKGYNSLLLAALYAVDDKLCVYHQPNRRYDRLSALQTPREKRASVRLLNQHL